MNGAGTSATSHDVRYKSAYGGQADQICSLRAVLFMTQSDIGVTAVAYRSVVECRLASLRLDVGRPDHLGPLFNFCGDELAEVVLRAWKEHTAQLSETGLDPRIN